MILHWTGSRYRSDYTWGNICQRDKLAGQPPDNVSHTCRVANMMPKPMYGLLVVCCTSYVP